MPVAPSHHLPGNSPFNSLPREDTSASSHAPQTTAPLEQTPREARDVRGVNAGGNASKARLIRAFLEYDAAPTNSSELPDAWKEMTDSIFQGEPVDVEEFEKILKNIDQSEEKGISIFLQKIRDHIYPQFTEKYGVALQAFSGAGASIRTKIDQSNKGVAEARVELQKESVTATQIMGQANRALYLASMLRGKLSSTRAGQAIANIESRHAAVKQQYVRIHVMDRLATGLLAFSQGRQAQKRATQIILDVDYGIGKKWDALSPTQTDEMCVEITTLVDEGRNKLCDSVQNFSEILNVGQMLPMDTNLFDQPLGVMKYSERVTKPIDTTRSLMGMAAVTLADSVRTLDGMLIDEYQFNFNQHYVKALASAVDIGANRPCNIDSDELAERRKAMAKLLQPEAGFCTLVDAIISRVKENLPLLTQLGLTAESGAPSEKEKVEHELAILTDSLLYAASDQMKHRLHVVSETVWYGAQEIWRDRESGQQAVHQLTGCIDLIREMRDIASALSMLTLEGEHATNEYTKPIPSELRTAIIHHLSQSLTELPSRIAALHEEMQQLDGNGFSPDMLAWTKYDISASLSELNILLQPARTGLQMKIDRLPTEQQLASSQSPAHRLDARRFVKGHFVSIFQVEQNKLNEGLMREQLAQELIAESERESAANAGSASTSKKKKKKNRRIEKQPVVPAAASSRLASLPIHATPLKRFQEAHEKYVEEVAEIDSCLEPELLCIAEAATGSGMYSSRKITNAGEWGIALLNNKLAKNRAVAQLYGNIQDPDRAITEPAHASITAQRKEINEQIKKVGRDAKRWSERMLRHEAFSTLEFDKVVQLLELNKGVQAPELKQIRPLSDQPDLHRQMRRVKRNVAGNPERNPDNSFILENRPAHMQGWVLGYTLKIADEKDGGDKVPQDRKIVIHAHYDPVTNLIGNCSIKNWEERNWSINQVTGMPVSREPLSDSQRDLIRPLLDIGGKPPLGWRSHFPTRLTPAMIAQVPAAVVSRRDAP